MALYDFPTLPPLVDAVARMEKDPDLGPVRKKIARWHGLNDHVLRVFWKSEPTAHDKAEVLDAWKVLRPKGTVEHVQG
jgi:hypothetical protein